jgi:hypothetical protein
LQDMFEVSRDDVGISDCSSRCGEGFAH